MRNYISYTVLGVALIAGTSAASAQTVVKVLGAVATAPVETVETVRTGRSTTISPRHRIVDRHVIRSRVVVWTTARSRVANRVTTTRTTVTERVVPEPVVVAPPVVEAVALPTYTDFVQAPPVAPAPAYPERLYDVITPAPVAPPAPAPVGDAMFGAGTAVPTYRYVYEPNRILVIDPCTNIAMQAIPR